MNNQAVILFIAKTDTIEPFRAEIERRPNLQVKVIAPPPELFDLPLLITQHQADVVIVEQNLPSHSEVTYMGIDVFELLQNALPSQPLYVLTESTPSSELNELPTGQLIRKDDFLGNDAFRQAFLQQIAQVAQHHRQAQFDSQDGKHLLQELWAKNGITQEVVNTLAQLHFKADRAIEKIIWMPNGKDNEVRLLEVNRTTIPSKKVLVFHFAPSSEIPFQQSIADVTPIEWKQIHSGTLSLPEGWNLKTAHAFQRSQEVWKGKQSVG
jgi:hypothetical protein